MMREFLRRNGVLIAVLGALLLGLVGFQSWAEYVTQAPLDTEISLSPKSVVEQEIHIPVSQRYPVLLDFQREGQDFHGLLELTGSRIPRADEKPPQGVAIPVRWRLKSASGVVVASGERADLKPYSFSAKEISVSIGNLHVPKGDYVFNAEVLGNVREFAHIKTRIAIRKGGKEGETWHSSAVFWGYLASWLLLGPLCVILLSILAWRTLALAGRRT